MDSLEEDSIWLDHCHLYQNGLSASRPEAGTISHLKRLMDQLGTEKAVAFATCRFVPPATSDEDLARTNEWLLDVCEREAQILPVVAMNPRTSNAVEKLEEYVARGAVGIKIHPIDTKTVFNDPALEEFYSAAEEFELPITFHTGVHGWYLKNYDPLLLDEVAENHPKLHIILAHVGGAALFYHALAVLHNHSNTFAGLVGNRRQRNIYYYLSNEQISLLLESVRPDRMIYGTDFPLSAHILDDIRGDIHDIRNWPAASESKPMILSGTARRLYEKMK